MRERYPGMQTKRCCEEASEASCLACCVILSCLVAVFCIGWAQLAQLVIADPPSHGKKGETRYVISVSMISI